MVEAVAELDKPGGISVNKLKRYFGEKHPYFNVEFKAHLLINALERLAGSWRPAFQCHLGFSVRLPLSGRLSACLAICPPCNLALSSIHLAYK